MIDQRPPKGPLFAEGAGRAKRGLGADEGIGPYKHERGAAEDRGATIPQLPTATAPFTQGSLTYEKERLPWEAAPFFQLKLPSCLPERTWKWMWWTVWPASSPTLVTTR